MKSIQSPLVLWEHPTGSGQAQAGISEPEPLRTDGWGDFYYDDTTHSFVQEPSGVCGHSPRTHCSCLKGGCGYVV
ncbi:hypothetical protein SBV1_1520018 [Verrucomicrobia bacterium]|nr:hypothetical protein SBV1_1520018 [Verrucomicrobiota bacterium]